MKKQILQKISALKKLVYELNLLSFGVTLTVVTIALYAQTSHANTVGEVTEVRRNITLANDEAPVKDFYIKISDGSVVKKNTILKAVRKLEAKDLGQKKVGDFRSTVGLLKVLYVEGNVAIAREHQKVLRTEQPMLEQIGIMMGDSVEPLDASDKTKKESNNAALKSVNKKSTVAKMAPVKKDSATRAPASIAQPVALETQKIGPSTQFKTTANQCDCSSTSLSAVPTADKK